jgi:hypothetical protein
MRRFFAAVTRKPVSWNIIDAFARLQEREEELRDASGERGKPRKGDKPKDGT